ATLLGLAGAVVAAALGHAGLAAAAIVVASIAASRRGAAGPRVDVDGGLMRLVDVMLAFPFVLLVMAIGAALDRTNAVTIFVTLGATGWVGIARVLRAKTMQVRASEYVEASRALGQSTVRLMLKHVLPNVAGTLVVTATVQVAQMIVADSVLSYLGLGISHDTAAFAAHSIATWWKREGSRRWGRVPKLLVLADSGGSNSCRSWVWKTELQAQVCNAFGFTVTIAHY